MRKPLIEEFSSSNLFEKMSLLTEAQINEIYKGIEWTVKNYPSAVIIGGTAVVHYLKQSRNITPDLDFLVDDISELQKTLQNDGVSYSSIKGDKGDIGITVKEFNTDYLSVNSGNSSINKLVLKLCKKANIGGYSVNIIYPPELLAIMKIELGRNKDVDDGLALITSKTLNKDIYLKIVNGLKSHLNDYESLVSYADIF